MTIQEVEEYITGIPIYQYAFLKTKDLEFDEQIRTVCKKECPHYGSSWSCPPAVGSLDSCRERCLGYENALLFSSISDVFSGSDENGDRGAGEEHGKLTRQIEQYLKDRAMLTYTLSSDACRACAKCAYPKGDCRHLELMHPCIMSHGIVIHKLIGQNLMDYDLGEEYVVWFSLIFFRES